MAGRRPNYSGSVRKVSENKYVAEITVGVKENGKPNKKQFSARTKAEATRKLNEYKKSLNLENPQQIKKKTVNAMTEPGLYILHRVSKVQHNGGATMS